MSAPLNETAPEAQQQPEMPLEGAQATTQPEQQQPPVDIDGYQKLVEKLRDENKALKADRQPQDEKDRQTIAALKRQLKESDPAKIKTEIAQAVAKAMGIEEEAPDPAQLTARLTEQTTAAHRAKVELAVYRAAAGAGADPTALLDSVTFVRSLTDVDPTDAQAVTAAIEAAKAANPALALAPSRRVPAPNPAVGSSAAGAPSIDDEINAAKKAGDVKKWMHLENQKLLAAPGR